jgi:hypothetical protein
MTTNNNDYNNTLKKFFKSKNSEKQIKTENIGIGAKIKNIIENDYNILSLGILLIILFLLIYLLYKNTFKKLANKARNNVDYYKKLDKINPNIEVCGIIDDDKQYRLCDYYIASSYNTPCIGNPHFDYIDDEMYGKVLNSGARYIQLPICGRNVNYDTEPVVATAERGKNLITSLNTLDLRTTLSIIRSYAFKYVKNVNKNPNNGEDIISLSSSNYPLIIHLEINTNNVSVMNKAYEDIKDIIGSYILSPEKYRSYPISLEKLCKLSNKILLFATSGYELSKLDELVIPTKYCFRSLTIEDIEDTSKDELSQEDIEDYFSKNISFINQKNSYKNLEIIKNNLDKILENGLQNKNNSSKLLDDLFSNKSIEYGKNKNKNFKNLTGENDLFTMYNMIGLTLIEPMTQSASITINPNPYNAFNLGCQLIPMNYHLNDNTMNTYINIFSKSSFVLKPSGLRLGLKENEVEDLLEKYGSISLNVDKLNIIPNFLYTLSNQYILLREQASGSKKTLSNLANGHITFINLDIENDNITTNNVFKVIPSSLSNKHDCICLLTHDNLAITIDKNFKNSKIQVSLKPLSTNLKELQYQTFYPEVGLILKDQGILDRQNDIELFVSFRLYNDILENTSKILSNNNDENKKNNTYYLAFEKNKLRILNKNDNNIKLCSFSYHKLNTKIYAQFFQMNYGAISVNIRSGVIYCARNKKINKAYKFKITNYNDNSENKFKKFNKVLLQLQDNRFISSNNNMIIVDDIMKKTPDDNNIFYIGKENVKDDDFIIMNNNGFILGINKNNTLQFMNENNSNLSNTKYFDIKYTFNTFKLS